MDNLWEKDLYINDNIMYLFNTEIFEYDMKDAGFSLSKEFNLLDKDILDSLEDKDKEYRTKKLGIYQRDNKEYANSLKEAFRTARKLFFIDNELEKSDIISVKKDAIFTSKRCKKQQIGKYINFRPKNTYTSYIYFGKKLEVYYGYDKFDVKGISDTNKELHEKYMIDFISSFIHKMESEQSSSILGFLKRFIDSYKWRELEIGYYRPFNEKSLFELYDGTEVSSYDEVMDLNINYNFYNILLQLIKIPL